MSPRSVIRCVSVRSPNPDGSGWNVLTEPPHFRLRMMSWPPTMEWPECLVVERRGREGEQYAELPGPRVLRACLAWYVDDRVPQRVSSRMRMSMVS
jgi:hypothetical protein